GEGEASLGIRDGEADPPRAVVDREHGPACAPHAREPSPGRGPRGVSATTAAFSDFFRPLALTLSGARRYAPGDVRPPRRGVAPRSLQPRSRPGRAIEAPGNTGESTSKGLVARLLLVVATGAGAGLAPVAPGTAGAAVGVALFALLAGLGPWLYAL